tara:strand:- start:310 stop:711 length:402 start_codon:yes stop_codon:yes gene_type:complete
MISKKIIKLASNTLNFGLKNRYSHKTSLKNSICGDRIIIELIVKNKKITSMKYETESCIYCEASASLLSKKIKKLNTNKIKKEFLHLKKISKKRNVQIPHKYVDFNELLNSGNISRFKCIFLPFDAVLKALKL